MSRIPQSIPRRVLQAAFIVLLFPVILPLLALVFVAWVLQRLLLYLLVWALWLPKGKDVLLVYSDSTIWREYVIENVLPLVRERAVVLNWSERRTWKKWSLAVRIFHCFGGAREFNPLVVLFRPFIRARIFRFWLPFKDWKRGFTEPVERVRNDLITRL